jgi:energy-coupling factor transporter ATP-binding protein EcfA2
MLTRLTVRNFKRFAEVEIELGNPVVFVGPNNSGKTTALQALALWQIGVSRWNEKRSGSPTPEKRPGVTINRRDLIAIPVPDANLLWRDLHVRDVRRQNGKPRTRNIRIDIIVEGVTDGKAWSCGLEFDYANEESLYCRPLQIAEEPPERMVIPPQAGGVRVAFLPPMSGLASNETKLELGAINVRLGEGRTAEVLRNLCYLLFYERPSGARAWTTLTAQMQDLFGVILDEPVYLAERGEIAMTYRNPPNIRLDLSTAGRGLQQTLLLLAHLLVNPGSVLLLDEPDAHLEILRQRQIYQVLSEAARTQNCQIIAASHSEVLLNEAADRDVVVAFLGRPHRIDDRGSQLLKSLKEIGFDQYYQAEQRGWVLYLEGSTDLAILRAFAGTLGHPAEPLLQRPFAHYVQNQPQKVKDHFYGLREAQPGLVGFSLFDRLARAPQEAEGLRMKMWSRREIENYLASQSTLRAYARSIPPEVSLGPLFEDAERERWSATMSECIRDYVPGAALRDPADRWWKDVKASDEFLDRLFEAFFHKLALPNLMQKTNYHTLARHVPRDEIDPEVIAVLDAIVEVAARAKPVGDWT